MDLASILTENIIMGIVLGFGLGFLFTLVTKAVKIFFICAVLLLKYLEAQHIIIVDWYRLSMGMIGQKELVIDQAISLADMLIEMGSFGVALVAGFFLAKKVF